MLQDLEKEFGDTYHFVEMKQEYAKDICKLYGIRKIPVLLLFKNKEVVSSMDGFPPRGSVKEMLLNV
jgi:thioredoxin-like negative regulator of GroEL